MFRTVFPSIIRSSLLCMHFCVVLCIVCFVSFCVLFVCKFVLNYCHRVATQLQLTNIAYHIQQQAYIKQILRPAASGDEFHLDPSRSRLQYLFDTCLLLYLQS
jgi:hypothetical protein